MTGVAILVDGLAIRPGQVMALDGVDFKFRPAPRSACSAHAAGKTPPAELDVGRRWLRAQLEALGLPQCRQGPGKVAKCPGWAAIPTPVLAFPSWLTANTGSTSMRV
jgi:hypothetical protein